MLNNFGRARSVSLFPIFSHSIHVSCDVHLHDVLIDYSVRDFIVAFGRSRQRQRGGQQREALCRCVADNKRGSATGGLLNRSTQYIISSRDVPGNAGASWTLETFVSQHPSKR